jgi:hypothetical protein
MPNAALEFEHLFCDSTEPIEQEVPDGQDYFAKFFKDAEYDAGAGGDGHAAKLAVESARIDARAKSIFQKIAEDAAAKTDASLLNKRGTTVEETVYASGRIVVAELEDGVVVRTFTKNAEQA